MHVVHVVTKLDVGGAQRHVADLAAWQHAAGHRVTVVAGLDGPVADEVRGAGVDVRITPSLRRSPNPWHDGRALGVLAGELRSRAPDVVHTHSSKGGLLGRMAARRLGVAAVYTAHGWPFQAAAPLAQRTMSRAGETFAGHWWGEVICLTPAEADLARRLHVVPGDRIHLVPLGLPDGPVRDWSVPSDRSRVRLIMVARFAPPKDHPAVLRALAPLRELSWTLQLVGDGPGVGESRALAGALGLADRVEFLGTRDDVPSLLAAADVAVLASRYEGMPLAVLEAMRAGVPVVASDLPGVRFILGETGAGLVASSLAQWTAAVRDLAGDESGRRRRGLAGRAAFEQASTIDVMGHRVDTVYERATIRISSQSRT